MPSVVTWRVTDALVQAVLDGDHVLARQLAEQIRELESAGESAPMLRLVK